MLARIKQGKGPASCFVSYERASYLIVLPAQQPAAHRKSGTFSDISKLSLIMKTNSGHCF